MMSSSALNVSEEIDQIFNNYHYGTFGFDAWVESDSTNLSNPDNESYYYSPDLANLEPSHSQFCTVFVDCNDPDTFMSTTRCTICQTEIEDNKHDFTMCSKCASIKKSKQTIKVRARNPRQRKTNNLNQKNKKNANELNAKPYQCKYCDEYFGSISSLLDHVKIHSDIRCETCGRSFYSVTELQDHMKFHNGITTNKRVRTLHESSQNRKHKIFDNEVHQTTQTPASRLTESITSKIKIIDTDKLFRTCNMCGKMCSKNSLHICMEGTEKLPEDEIPEMEYRIEDRGPTLKYEESFLQPAEQSPQYKCSYCNESFSQVAVLNAHTMTHNLMNRFQCKFCDQRFQKSCLLLRHVQHVHNVVQ